MRKPIAMLVLFAALTLATFGCATGVSQEEVDALRADVRSLEAEVTQLRAVAITTENVGEVITDAITDWGGQIVGEAVEKMGAAIMADLREQMQEAITETIGNVVGDTLDGFNLPFGNE